MKDHSSRRIWAAGFGAAGLVAVAAVAGVLFLGRESSAPAESTPSAGPPAAPETTAPARWSTTDQLLRDFVAARVAGTGAERFLNVPEKAVPLLYATSSGAPYVRGQVERVPGIQWPYGYTAYKVRLFAEDTTVEQLLFKPPERSRGLVYEPDGFASAIAPTTEKGRPVAVPYTSPSGGVTTKIAHPWVPSSVPDTFQGHHGGLRFVPDTAQPTTDAEVRNGWDKLVLMSDPTLYGTCWRASARPRDARALAEAIRAEPIWTTAPKTVNVGRTEALMLDVVIPAGDNVPFCPRSESGLVSSVVNPNGGGRFYDDGRETGYATGDRMRLYLIDAPDGSQTRVLAAAILAPESRLDRVAEAARPIIASVQFRDAPNGSPVVADGEQWLAFTGRSPGITLVRVDGTGGHEILGSIGRASPAWELDWSPDGSQIAYMQGRSPKLVDVQGEDPRPLIRSVPDDLDGLFWSSPAWSPDGSEVALVGSNGYHPKRPFRATLVTVDVSTGEITRVGGIAKGRVFTSPRWSPDGEAIVYTATRYACDHGCDAYRGATIVVVRRSGDTWSAPKEITPVGRFGPPDWHPSKDLIVVGDDDRVGASADKPTRLFTVRSDGSRRTTVLATRSPERPSGPRWTPDGRIIVTLRTVTGESRGIAVLNADGSGLKVVVPADEVRRYGSEARMRPR